MTDEQLDLRGLKCPLPVLHTRKLLNRLPLGGRAVVLCTDPLAGIDIPHLMHETRNKLVSSVQVGAEWRFVIRRDA